MIEEGDQAEASLRREIRASNSLLRGLIARILLFEVRRQRRQDISSTGKATGASPVNDQLSVSEPPGDRAPLREAG